MTTEDALDSSYQPAIYKTDGGDTLVIDAGGAIDILPGATIGACPAIADVPTPATATVLEVATTLNSVMDALRAAGLIS